MRWTFEDMSAKKAQGNLTKAPVQVRIASQSGWGGFVARQQALWRVCCARLTVFQESLIGLPLRSPAPQPDQLLVPRNFQSKQEGGICVPGLVRRAYEVCCEP